MKLPIVDVGGDGGVDGNDTCFSCPAPCCTSYIVPIGGFDLWRLVRGLQLPWREVAEVRPERVASEGFALDASEVRLGLSLRSQPGTETCRFLLFLPNGRQRCGAHGARPMACRVYPFRPDGNSQPGIDLIPHAMCPEPQRAHFHAHRAEARGAIQEELAERQLSLFAVQRWNERVAASGGSYSPDDFAAWVLALYDALLPLREGPGWQPAARQLINDYW